jgi:hypothetical protein
MKEDSGMAEITRRDALALAGAAVLAAAIPPAEAAIAPTAPPLPAWAVGTPGEWNWQAVEALTEHEAKLAWIRDQYQIEECEDGCGGSDECDCEFCDHLRSLEADRKPKWDGKSVTAGDTTWFASGLGAYCDRCSYETSRDECGHVVNNEVVCEQCMTLADWDIVDPEHAAELREESEA